MYDPIFANIAMGMVLGIPISFILVVVIFGIKRKYKHPIVRNRSHNNKLGGLKWQKMLIR